MYPFVYLILHTAPTILIILAMGIVTLTGIAALILLVTHDKADRKIFQDGQRIREDIKNMIDDDVLNIEWQYDNKYNVYTNTKQYIVEYGEELSRVTYIGEHKTIHMEGIR